MELEATKKPQFKNVIAIAGLETLKDKNGIPYKWSATFANNVETWVKDNWIKRSGGKAVVLDARYFKDRPNPLADLCDALVTTSQEMEGGLEALFYSGHGDMETFYIFSKTHPELPDRSRFIMLDYPEQDYWSQINWSKGSNKGIWLATCRAGGDDRKWDHCMAQRLADMTGVTTWGFISRCAQKQRADGGYYQKPDIPGYVAFKKTVGKEVPNSVDDTKDNDKG
jgi:hypothetical protein